MTRVYKGGTFVSVAAIVAAWIAIGVGGGGGGGNGTSSCPAPKFPDLTCVGVPSSVTLTPYTGPNPVTADNAVIDGKLITGGIEVRGANVTIRNSRITDAAVAVLDNNTSYGKAPLHLEDSEVDCGGVGGSGIVEANITIRRVWIHGCENGMSITQNIDMRDSYISALIDLGGTEAHEDGVQFGSGHWDPACVGTGCSMGFAPGALNITFIHNTIFGMNGDGSFGTSGFIMNPNGIDTNILIQGNLLAGGGYTVYCPGPKPIAGPVGDHGTNIRVINNHFSTRFTSSVGFFGPSSGDCHDEADISGNVIHETGLPLVLQ